MKLICEWAKSKEVCDKEDDDVRLHTKVTIYGKERNVSYIHRDLLWGRGLYRKLHRYGFKD